MSSSSFIETAPVGAGNDASVEFVGNILAAEEVVAFAA